jgi:hypothetical protein
MCILTLVSNKFNSFCIQIHQWKHWEDEFQKDAAENGSIILFATHVLVKWYACWSDTKEQLSFCKQVNTNVNEKN